jgi:hypothetical protein
MVTERVWDIGATSTRSPLGSTLRWYGRSPPWLGAVDSAPAAATRLGTRSGMERRLYEGIGDGQPTARRPARTMSGEGRREMTMRQALAADRPVEDLAARIAALGRATVQQSLAELAQRHAGAIATKCGVSLTRRCKDAS